MRYEIDSKAHSIRRSNSVPPQRIAELKAYDRSVFELTPSFTVVTFPFEQGFIMANDKINDKIKTTLDVIKSDPTATIARLSELTGKSQSAISRELKRYQASGVLRREGARKNGRWVLSVAKLT
ncbi:MAG: MarR family transcriptional regulator [Oscillospiraceae bacterium]|nr:MarR family transcriptional regulator [Oscillospiraceae bacterium]